jgi:hypothetical protein
MAFYLTPSCSGGFFEDRKGSAVLEKAYRLYRDHCVFSGRGVTS